MWNRVLNKDSNRLPHIVYDNMMEIDNLWYLEVKIIFTSADIMELLIVQLFIQYSVEWIDGMCLKSKLHLYRTFKDQYSVATYCNINLTRAQRVLVAKIRL